MDDLKLDRVQSTYARTAWTPADPLAGLPPALRLALLMEKSTFRERWRLRFWKTREQKREALRDILAERRLKLEIDGKAPAPVHALAAPESSLLTAPPQPLSPYYQDRLARFQAERREQDRQDLERLPEARKETQQRLIVKERWLELQLAKVRIEQQEQQLLTGQRPETPPKTLPTHPEPSRADPTTTPKPKHRHRMSL